MDDKKKVINPALKPVVKPEPAQTKEGPKVVAKVEPAPVAAPKPPKPKPVPNYRRD